MLPPTLFAVIYSENTNQTVKLIANLVIKSTRISKQFNNLISLLIYTSFALIYIF